MKEKSFDERIKQKADAHEAAVPADAWANIAQQKRKKRYGFSWWSVGAFTLTAVTLCGIYISHLSNEKNSAKDIADNKTQTGNLVSKETKNTREAADADTVAGKKDKLSLTANAIPADTWIIATTGAKSPGCSNKGSISANATDQITTDPTSYNRPVSLNKKNTTGKTIGPISESSDIAGSNAPRSGKRKSLRGKTKVVIQSGPAGTDDENAFADLTNKKYVADTDATFKNDHITDVEKARDSIRNIDSFVLANSKVIPKITIRSQDAGSPKKVPPSFPKKNNIMFDLAVQPFFVIAQKDKLNYVTRTTITSSGKREFTATDIRSSVQPSFSFSAELYKKLSDKWYAGSGLQYSIVKEHIRLSGTETNTTVTIVKRLENIGGIPVLREDTLTNISTGKRVINATNSYRFITIPFSFHYELMNKKAWTVYISGGLNLNISSYNNSITGQLEPTYTSSSRPGNKDNKVTTDIYAGLRLSRRFGNKYDLFAEPAMLYNINGYNLSNQVNNAKLHKAGIGFGISWKLN